MGRLASPARTRALATELSIPTAIGWWVVVMIYAVRVAFVGALTWGALALVSVAFSSFVAEAFGALGALIVMACVGVSFLALAVATICSAFTDPAGLWDMVWSMA